MIDHDRLSKELLSTFFIEFLELFLPEMVEAILTKITETIGILD